MMRPAIEIDGYWFAWRRHTVRDIEARLYYPSFSPPLQRGFSPAPDFSDLEEAGRDGRRPLGSLAISCIAHLIVIGFAAGSWGGNPPVKSSARAPDGIAVKLVDAAPTGPTPSLKPTYREEAVSKADGLASQARPVLPLSDARSDMAIAGSIDSAISHELAQTDPPPGLVAASAPMTSVGARGDVARTGSAEEGRWESAIVYRLAERKRYPGKALRAALSDTVMLRITIDRGGRLLLAEIAKSRGIAPLDKEALALAERASPYPAPPDSVFGDAVRLVVPIEFVMGERH